MDGLCLKLELQSLVMRGRKEPERQEQYTLSSNPCEATSLQPDQLLDDIYKRIKAKSVVKQGQGSDSNEALLSYISHTHENGHTKETTHTSDSIQLATSIQRPQKPFSHPDRLKKAKKMSYNERIKTDLDELDSVSEVEFLRRENELLKNKLARCEQRVVTLESFECEAEYMRKLVLIQDSEIGKLRRMLKASRQSQLAMPNQENRPPQCASLGLKDPILISDHDQPPKKKKCSHKVKEDLYSHLRTQPIEQSSAAKNRSFYSKSKEQVAKKITAKPRKDKQACR